MVDIIDKLEAAACLWEAMLDLYSRDRSNVQECWENCGTATIRLQTIAYAEDVHNAWALAVEEKDYDEAFDWEFVPDWIHENLEFTPMGIERKQV